MPRNLHLLKKNDLPGEIEIHSDLLSIMPSALSRKRALKVGREPQKAMRSTDPPSKCLLCHPQENKPPGTSEHKTIIDNRVGSFENDFPYLPGDQHVIYLWHSDSAVREESLHRFKLKDFGRIELYWLVKGCTILGHEYPVPDQTYDLMRMVAGFNLGKLAGQSLTHFHLQYGWEVVLKKRTITGTELDLYFEELEYCDLILYQDSRVRVVVPWTPKGQFALDLYFVGKHGIVDMDEIDLKILAVFGERIIKKYLQLGIQNINIVFSNSPAGRSIDPLIVHFVPRVNMTALYEIKGVNVVDTPPQKIAEEFRRSGSGKKKPINWVELLQLADAFTPDLAFEERFKSVARLEEGRGGNLAGPARLPVQPR